MKSLIIQYSWNCAVAICRRIMGTQLSNLCSTSVCSSARRTNSFWSRAISACAAWIDPGGRICQRAIFACRRFCPSSSTPWTESMAAFTRFWTIRPTTTCATMNTMKPQPMLQPTPHTPPKKKPRPANTPTATEIKIENMAIHTSL